MKALLTCSIMILVSSFLSGCAFFCWLCELGEKPVPIQVASGPPILFTGRIMSNLGGAVGGAIIQINGDKTLSNADGSFSLPAKIAARYVLNIQKEGFAPLSRVTEASLIDWSYTMTQATVEQVDPTQEIRVHDKLSQKGCQGSVNGAARIDWDRVLAGNRIAARNRSELEKIYHQPKACSSGVEIVIPGNSLVDRSGNPPVGPVTVSLATADLFARDGMPGDFTVAAKRGERGGTVVAGNDQPAGEIARTQYSFMESYGAGSITVTANGKSYQPRPGTESIMTIPIDPTRLKVLKDQGQDPDATIPVMFFDDRTGLWHVDGIASLTSTKDAYVAKLVHFSWVNVDKEKVRPRCIKFDSASMPGMFDLSIAFPGFSSVRSVTNTPADHIHAVTRLPESTDVTLTAYQPGTPNVIAILPPTNTGVWAVGATPVAFPAPPYTECVDAGNLYKDLASVNKPTLTVTRVAQGFLTTSWNGNWTSDIAPHPNDGYMFEESTDGGASWHVVMDDIANTAVFVTSAGPGGVQDDRAAKSAPSAELPHFGKKKGNYRYRVKAFYGALPGADPTNDTFYKISVPVDIAIVDSRLVIVNNIAGGTFQDSSVLRLRIEPVADPLNPATSSPKVSLTIGDPSEHLPVDATCNTPAAAAASASILMNQIAPTEQNNPNNLVTNLQAPHYDIYLELGWWKGNFGTSNPMIYPTSSVICFGAGNYSKQLYNLTGASAPTHYHRHFGNTGYIRVQNHYTGDLTLTITGTANSPSISSATYVVPPDPTTITPTFVTIPMIPIGVTMPLQTSPTPDPIGGTY